MAQLPVTTKKSTTKPLPSLARIKEVLALDPSTGALTWRAMISKRAPVGTVVANKSSKGYIRVGIDGENYFAHRIVWLMYHGVAPSLFIDHINGIKTDNRPANLREGTHFQNMGNQRCARRNKVGLMGAYWAPNKKKWVSAICVHGKSLKLGAFESEELAHAAYINAKRELHEFCTI